MNKFEGKNAEHRHFTQGKKIQLIPPGKEDTTTRCALVEKQSRF